MTGRRINPAAYVVETGRTGSRVFPAVEERALRPPVEPNGNEGLFPSSVGEDVDTPGEVGAVEFVTDPATPKAFASFSTVITPSPWSGWPAEWDTPLFNGSGRYCDLVDTAWAAIDLNASILSTMPPYRTRDGLVIEPTVWMENPDPDLYTSWEEFAKQLFWSHQIGEVFVLPTAYADGLPARMHVVEPWLVNAEMDSGRRHYRIGSLDVTDEILPIRYKSTTEDARGHGPLEAGKNRVIAAGVLARYVAEMARGGGIPHFVLKHPDRLTQNQADELLHNWWENRMSHLGLPAVMSGGLEAQTLQTSAKDMALLELAEFTEARIAVLLGVPPFLLGLPSGGNSMTYSNVSSLFDYYWRAGLRPKAQPVMAALSWWGLPRGERIELNRDEFVRPDFGARATAWATLHGIEDDTGRVITAEQIAAVERFNAEQTGRVSAPATINGGI